MTQVTIAIPCLNEEAVLEQTVRATLNFIRNQLGDFKIMIVVVDNGSEDRTEEIGRRLAAEFPDVVRYQRLDQRGKGLAIRSAWRDFPADIYAFMDADLATDLAALPRLLATCRDQGGLVIGSRHLPESDVERSALRRLISFGYRLMLRLVLKTSIRDLPCGFKAIDSETAKAILPQTQDSAWFFDTELAIRTERSRRSVIEIPVRWREANQDGRQSKVPLFRVAADYLKRAWRLRRELNTRS
jgi:glycosyltransferase involved in cell wall biosynthesis